MENALLLMAQCPTSVRGQVERLVARTRAIVDEDLVGVYMHGSLAMGGFHPGTSDIDLLAITRSPLPVGSKRPLVEMLLDVSRDSSPVEVTFLAREDLHPWRHPAPFDLHYSETWRKQYRDELASGAWQRWNEGPRPADEDLAAHVTVARARGVVLWGPPIVEVFPPVPREDYLASVRGDIEWALENPNGDPSYVVLNLCRTLAYLADGQVRSKEEGGEWGLAHLPDRLRPAAGAALERYRGGPECELAAASIRDLLGLYRARETEMRG